MSEKSTLRGLAIDMHAHGGRPSLAWMMEHCPGGDFQAFVQGAWDTTRDYVDLLDLVGAVSGRLARYAMDEPLLAARIAYRPWIDQGITSVIHPARMAREDHVCLLAIRAAMPVAPTVVL